MAAASHEGQEGIECNGRGKTSTRCERLDKMAAVGERGRAGDLGRGRRLLDLRARSV